MIFHEFCCIAAISEVTVDDQIALLKSSFMEISVLRVIWRLVTAAVIAGSNVL